MQTGGAIWRWKEFGMIVSDSLIFKLTSTSSSIRLQEVMLRVWATDYSLLPAESKPQE